MLRRNPEERRVVILLCANWRWTSKMKLCWGKGAGLKSYPTLHFYFISLGSIVWTWRSASSFHNNLAYWKTAGFTNPQLSALQGLLMELQIPVKQAAHCWHVPGGLVGGWRRCVGRQHPFVPLALCGYCHSGDCVSLSRSLEWLRLLLQGSPEI